MERLEMIEKLRQHADISYEEAKQILDETGVNEYRLNKAFESLRNLRKEQIISLLAKLSDLDISCKSDSSLPDASRFELFILEFLKRG